MVDGVDIHTTWNEMRALANRGEKATVEQIWVTPFLRQPVRSGLTLR
jgi:hypothetical protein